MASIYPVVSIGSIRSLRTLFKRCYHNGYRYPLHRGTLTSCSGSVCQRRQFHSEKDRAPRVLITGGLGQLGVDLTKALRSRYGADNVVQSDIQKPRNRGKGPFLYLDVLKVDSLREAIVNYEIDWIIHFSAILSAVGEQNVPLAMRINTESLHHVLQVARQFNLKIFVPSTIGAFGPNSQRVNTPDVTIQQPITAYGVSKVYGELLGSYFHRKFGVDFRCLRFPGIISAESKPGGGTTDYAIQIFHDALEYGKHECYLQPDARLPMLYIEDCIDSIIKVMEIPADKLSQRVYNVTSMSFSPDEIASVIKRRIKEFEINYNVCQDRQAIAESWPVSLDDSNARRDWNWNPKYDLDATVDTMLGILRWSKPYAYSWWQQNVPHEKIEVDGRNLYKVEDQSGGDTGSAAPSISAPEKGS